MDDWMIHWIMFSRQIMSRGESHLNSLLKCHHGWPWIGSKVLLPCCMDRFWNDDILATPLSVAWCNTVLRLYYCSFSTTNSNRFRELHKPHPLNPLWKRTRRTVQRKFWLLSSVAFTTRECFVKCFVVFLWQSQHATTKYTYYSVFSVDISPPKIGHRRHRNQFWNDTN